MRNRGEKAKGKAAGRCIFCDGFGMSKEHIWSDWISESGLLPRAKEHQQFLMDLDMMTPDVVALQPKMVPAKQGPLIQKKIRKVCRTCNNTWMGAIVDEARPAAAMLIRQKEFDVIPEIQRRLSSWIALATIMAEYTHEGSRSISNEDRMGIFISGELSENWRILIGRHDAADWLPHRYRHFGGKLGLVNRQTHARPSGPSGALQVSTYTLGPLAVRAFTSEHREMIDHHDATAPCQMKQIWPTTRTFQWPADDILHSTDMMHLSDEFTYLGFVGQDGPVPRKSYE